MIEQKYIVLMNTIYYQPKKDFFMSLLSTVIRTFTVHIRRNTLGVHAAVGEVTHKGSGPRISLDPTEWAFGETEPFLFQRSDLQGSVVCKHIPHQILSI